MEADADAPVRLQVLEVEVLEAARHLAGVVEEREVERQAARNPPELRRRQERVAIAEAPGGVAAQRPATPEERQEIVGHAIVIVEHRLHAAAEREHPRFAQDRQMLDDLAVEALEAVGLVAVGIVGEGDGVEAAGARVAGRDAPVDRRNALGCGCTSGARTVPSRSWRRARSRWTGPSPSLLRS